MRLSLMPDHSAALVAAGIKRAALACGPRPRVGERLALMLGDRRLLEPSPACRRVAAVAVLAAGGPWAVAEDGRWLGEEEAHALARRLGHRDAHATGAYYRDLHGPAFVGHLVEW